MFAAWHKMLNMTHKERAKEAKEREMAEEKAKHEQRRAESRQKILMAMTDRHECHAVQVLKSSFKAWHWHGGELRKEKLHTRQMMAVMVSGQSHLVFVECF